MNMMKRLFSLSWLLIFLVIDFKQDLCAAAMKRTPSNNNGIDQIHKACDHSDDHNLCIRLLKSDPRSLTADAKGLAGIMLELTQKNAVHTFSIFYKGLKSTNLDQEMKKGFLACVDVYKKATTSNIPEALNSLHSNSFAAARKEGSEAFITIQTCERELIKSGGLAKDPRIIEMNKFDQHLASLSLDIIYTLG